MTDTPPSQRPEQGEPVSGSSAFTPGRPPAGSAPPQGSSGGAVLPSQPGSPPARQGAPGGTSASSSTSGRTAGKTTSGDDPLARTKVSGIWIGIIVFALVLILLLVFVLQNTAKVPITYFWATGHLPLAVAMLLSAVAGVLLAAIAGTLRIMQLRKRLKANTS